METLGRVHVFTFDAAATARRRTVRSLLRVERIRGGDVRHVRLRVRVEHLLMLVVVFVREVRKVQVVAGRRIGDSTVRVAVVVFRYRRRRRRQDARL